MGALKSSQITIRVSEEEKEKFQLLSKIYKLPVSKLIIDLVEKELEARKLTASELRQLPKEIRARYLKQMTEQALPVYNKYRDELEVEETGDGIE